MNKRKKKYKLRRIMKGFSFNLQERRKMLDDLIASMKLGKIQIRKDNNYKFKISLSIDNYKSKEEVTRAINERSGRRKMAFSEVEVTSMELLNYGLNGKTFCNLFHNIPSSIKDEKGRIINLIRKSDGAFIMKAKSDLYFFGSYMICFDIENTKYESAASFIEKLTFKPTLYYSTFNNLQKNKDGSSKGARFRLVYVFDELIQGKVFFNYIFDTLNEIVEKDVGETTYDKCSRKPTQYFNGTNINNPDMIVESGITNYIYSFNNFNISKESDYLRWISIQLNSNKLTLQNKKLLVDEYEEVVISRKITNPINIIKTTPAEQPYIFNSSGEIILDDKLLYKWDNLTPEKFVKDGLWVKWLRDTKNIYRVEKDEWINNEYQFVDEDYFMLFWNTDIIRDGEKRRKGLYQRMCLRRIIYPKSTPNEILFNTILDILRNYDNSDKILNSEFLRRNITNCFNFTIEELKKTYNNEIKYLQSKTHPKKGIIYRDKFTHSRETTFNLIDDYYDPELNVSENLKKIKEDCGYEIKKSTMYNYLKCRNKKTKIDKLTDEEILKKINWEISGIKNFQKIKLEGFKIKKDRFFKLFRNHKNQNPKIQNRVI